MSSVVKHIESYEKLGFSFDNMHKRTSIIGVLPVQTNTNVNREKDENGVVKESIWFQVVANYKSSYSRTDENGEQHDDNATLKTIIVKFSSEHLRNFKVSTAQLKEFIDLNYTGKKFLFLPVSEEKQSFIVQGSKDNRLRVPVKNQSECVVDSEFDLNEFLKSETVGTKKS